MCHDVQCDQAPLRAISARGACHGGRVMPSSPVFPSDSEISSMPNKTIYVADADLPTFERAQELAGENLSATIACALRRFVKTEEARQQGFEEISLKVGSRKTF